MDNEISKQIIQDLRQQQTSYQLVPPHTHCSTIAERTIQTYNNHFKESLVRVDPNFPLSEWDIFIEKANITLNLLRSSRANTKVSAHTYIFGKFKFNATPLVPPGNCHTHQIDSTTCLGTEWRSRFLRGSINAPL